MASYRKKDPSNEEEKEFLENLYDSIYICMISSSDYVKSFKSS